MGNLEGGISKIKNHEQWCNFASTDLQIHKSVYSIHASLWKILNSQRMQYESWLFYHAPCFILRGWERSIKQSLKPVPSANREWLVKQYKMGWRLNQGKGPKGISYPLIGERMLLDARSEMWSILRNNALLDLASGLGKDLRCCCFGLSVSWQMFSIPTSISDSLVRIQQLHTNTSIDF